MSRGSVRQQQCILYLVNVMNWICVGEFDWTESKGKTPQEFNKYTYLFSSTALDQKQMKNAFKTLHPSAVGVPAANDKAMNSASYSYVLILSLSSRIGNLICSNRSWLRHAKYLKDTVRLSQTTGVECRVEQV